MNVTALNIVQIKILDALADQRERTLTDIRHKSGLPERTIKCEMAVLTRRRLVLTSKHKQDTAFTIYRIGAPSRGYDDAAGVLA